MFYDFSGVRERIGRWLQRAGNVKVLYDGACPFCRSTVRVLRGLDLFGRVAFEDFRSADLDELSRRHPGVTMAALDNEMLVIANHRPYRGFEGYRRLALALPALWPLVPVLFLPGAVPVGKRVYAYVARHRLAFVTCDATCPTGDWPIERPVGSSASRPARFAAWQLALAGLIAVQTLVWLNSLEFYPFTSVQMFKGKPGTVVTYYKTVGHWESGRASPIYLEDTLDVMSINSRYEGLFELCFGRSRPDRALPEDGDDHGFGLQRQERPNRPVEAGRNSAVEVGLRRKAA